MTIINANITLNFVNENKFSVTGLTSILGGVLMDNLWVYIIALLVWGAICLCINWQHSQLERQRQKEKTIQQLIVNALVGIAAGLLLKSFPRLR